MATKFADRWAARSRACAAWGALAMAVAVMPSIARASATMCPADATQGGFNNAFTSAANVLAPSCGGTSAVTMSIANATDYAKLTFGTGTSGWPAGLTLGNLAGVNAQVHLDTANDQPYFQLAFVDSSNSLGQGNAADQILLLEFQPSTVSGNDMDVDPLSTLFNLIDNTTNTYLQGGQQNAQTLAHWLGLFPVLESTSVDELRLAIGLAGGSGPAQSLTVDSVTISQTSTDVPEPTSAALVGLALVLAALGRRHGVSVAASGKVSAQT